MEYEIYTGYNIQRIEYMYTLLFKESINNVINAFKDRIRLNAKIVMLLGGRIKSIFSSVNNFQIIFTESKYSLYSQLKCIPTRTHDTLPTYSSSEAKGVKEVVMV